MEIQVYRDPSRTYYGHHPDPEAVGGVQEAIAFTRGYYEEFSRAAAELPNLNERYASELDTVRRIYNEEGLEVAPIYVLTNDDYEAFAIDGHNAGQGSTGVYMNGLILLAESSRPGLGDALIRKSLIGRGLHEGAHSTAREVGTYITSTPASDGRVIDITAGVHLDNFNKTRITEDGLVTEADFLEEGFADLERVRGLQKLGMEARAGRMTRANSSQDGLRYIDPERAAEVGPEPGFVDIPLRFLDYFEEDSDGEYKVNMVVPSVAAYGLELLCEQLPGLHDQMLAARKDPAAQRDVIGRINGLRPGLYRELRTIGDDLDAFKKGLKLIQDAIQVANQEAVVEQQIT